MEPAPSPVTDGRNLDTSDTSHHDSVFAEQRLAWLIDANESIERHRSLFRNDGERLEAIAIRSPMSSVTVFSTFGLMVGMLPLLAIAFKTISVPIRVELHHLFFLFLLAISTIATGLVGAALGKGVPTTLDAIRKLRTPNQIAALIGTGVAWGAVAGAAGGVFLFLIGALVGAFIGGFIGAIAVPPMAFAYEVLRRGDVMDSRHFLPIAFGISLTISAFILGL